MTFYKELEEALLQAIEIKKGNIPMIEVEDMPAKTYRAENVDEKLPIQQILLVVILVTHNIEKDGLYLMEYNYDVFFHWDEDEKYYIANVPALSGCMADGKTLGEAANAIQESIRIWIEVNTERGLEIPNNTTNKSIEDYAVPVYYDGTPMPDVKIREVLARMKELGRPLTAEELAEYYV